MTNPSQPNDPWDQTSRPSGVPGTSGSMPGSNVGKGPVAPSTEALTPPASSSGAVPSSGPVSSSGAASTSGATAGEVTPPLGGGNLYSGSDRGGSGSTTDTAKQEAANVKDTAVSAGSDVAQTAKEQAGNVVAEAKSQASDLLYQVRGEVGGQASTQMSRVADSLHSLSKELGEMASKSEQNGPMTDLVHQASRKGGEIAHWLQNREPTDVLDEVKSFARRRPVAFLGICFAAGLVAGRATRGAVAANTSLDSGSSERTPELRAGSRPDFTQPEYVPAPPASLVESGYSESEAGIPGPAAAAGVDPAARTTTMPSTTDPSFR